MGKDLMTAVELLTYFHVRLALLFRCNVQVVTQRGKLSEVLTKNVSKFTWKCRCVTRAKQRPTIYLT